MWKFDATRNVQARAQTRKHNLQMFVAYLWGLCNDMCTVPTEIAINVPWPCKSSKFSFRVIYFSSSNYFTLSSKYEER